MSNSFNCYIGLLEEFILILTGILKVMMDYKKKQVLSVLKIIIHEEKSAFKSLVTLHMWDKQGIDL